MDRLATGDPPQVVGFLGAALGGQRQLGEGAAQRLLGAVAEDSLRALIPAEDSTVQSLADDAVAGTLDDGGQARLLLEDLQTSLPTDPEHPDQRRQQQGQGGADQRHLLWRGLVQLPDECRIGHQLDLPAAAIDIALQAVAHDLRRRLGGAATLVESLMSPTIGDVVQAQVQALAVQFQALQHLLGQQRRVTPAEELQLALLRAGGRLRIAVDGQEDEERLQRLAGSLDQGDGPGQARLAAAHGRQCGLTPIVFRGDIQPDGGLVAGERLDVLDDETLARVWRQLADRKVRLAVTPGLVEEGLLLGDGYTAHETEATRPGKLLGYRTRLAVALEQLAADAMLAAGQHRAAHTAQAVLIEAKALDYPIGSAQRGGLQCLAGLLAIGALQHIGRQYRKQGAAQQGEDDAQAWRRCNPEAVQREPPRWKAARCGLPHPPRGTG